LLPPPGGRSRPGGHGQRTHCGPAQRVKGGTTRIVGATLGKATIRWPGFPAGTRPGRHAVTVQVWPFWTVASLRCSNGGFGRFQGKVALQGTVRAGTRARALRHGGPPRTGGAGHARGTSGSPYSQAKKGGGSARREPPAGRASDSEAPDGSDRPGPPEPPGRWADPPGAIRPGPEEGRRLAWLSRWPRHRAGRLEAFARGPGAR